MPSQIEGNYDSGEYERQLKGEMNCRATARLPLFGLASGALALQLLTVLTHESQ